MATRRPSRAGVWGAFLPVHFTACLVSAVAVVLAPPAAHAQPQHAPGVFVNGQAVPGDTVRALEQAYRVPIAPGRYWYDALSGAWGAAGGPIAAR